MGSEVASYSRMDLLLAYYSGGLKQDLTCSVRPDGSIRSDVLGWWDPPTCSWNKVSS